MFGDTAFQASADYGDAEPVAAQLAALAQLVQEGKVRAVGLSNETPWGLLKFLAAAEASAGALPRVASLQNAYSLTCRTFEARWPASAAQRGRSRARQAGLAECCHREAVSLIAYSPLAMGLLTGKYFAPGGAPPSARLNLYRGRYAEAEGRYSLERPGVRPAALAYAALAARHGLAPAELALRFAMSHPACACALTGATDAEQLAQLLRAAEAGPLPQELLDEIDGVHEQHPSPTP